MKSDSSLQRGNITGKKRKENSSVEESKWNFSVEYNDHFETPNEAYTDLMPVLTSVAEELGKSLEELIIYDPYYCDGRVVRILKQLGFRNVINANQDFYDDILTSSIPGISLCYESIYIY